jgi:O-succinylbenzoic acid--CoA ligase
MIPTGGSSGKITFVMHNWQTLTAAIRGFSEYFDEKKVNSCCLLPLYHVSGLMQCLRSFLTGGKLLILPYSDLKNNLQPQFKNQDYFLSLVPTQLQVLLELNPLWLSRFKTILLGGAPSWTGLLNQARKQQIPLALSYGMTETAALLVALKPEEFLQGHNSMGKILPHGQINIVTQEGKNLDYGQTGIIQIKALSLCLGYYPHEFSQDFLLSNDLGSFNSEGYLTILGRRNRLIITGGEKVCAEEVEKIIKDTGLVSDVSVLGVPNSYWGEILVAVYVSRTPNQGHQVIAEKVAGKLSKFKLPKHWLSIDCLPRNSQGKINEQQVKEWAIKQLSVV